MKPLSAYRVSDPFGATYAPWSPAKPHSGDDVAASAGTPITVSGTLIGHVGVTGKASGPHCHIQKAELRDGVWQFINPQGEGLNASGTVTEVGFNTEIGNFVRLRDKAGYRWSYFHMQGAPLVSVGQVINTKGEDMINDNDGEFNRWRLMFLSGVGHEPTREQFRAWAVGKTWLKAIIDVQDGPEFAKVQSAQEAALKGDGAVTKEAVLNYINNNLN